MFGHSWTEYARSGDEIRLLNEGYRLKHGRNLMNEVELNLSGRTERSKFPFFTNACRILKQF